MGWLSFLGIGGKPAVEKTARRANEPALNEEQRQEVVALVKGGQTVDAVAQQFGVSSRTIQRAVSAASEPVDLDRALKQAKVELEVKKVQLQTEAIEQDPNYRASILYGAGKERPVDEETIRRVRKFWEEQGQIIVDGRYLEGLEADLTKMRKKAAVMTQRLAETGEGGHEAWLTPEIVFQFIGLVSQIAGKGGEVNPAQLSALAAGAQQQIEPPADAGNPTERPEAPAPVVTPSRDEILLRTLTCLMEMEPAQAAELIYGMAERGVELSEGFVLADVFPIVLAVKKAGDLVKLLGSFQGIPAVEKLVEVAKEKPEWIEAWLESLRQIEDQRQQPGVAA